jgi:NTE family protein
MTSKVADKKVALALSSGGARGFAYIGALEELEARGYTVSSIAGTSIGSLVGGMYASGNLAKFKDWLFDLNTWKVFSLMDISLSMNSIVKGDRIIQSIQEIVPNIKIEDLNIPYCAIATDLYTGREVVFDSGDLYEAIRASISIPSMFRPVEYGNTLLVDGHSSNCLPLNRVKRTEGDILVGFDLNHFDAERIMTSVEDVRQKTASYEALRLSKKQQVRNLATTINHNAEASIFEKIRVIGENGWQAIKDIRAFREEYIDNLPEVEWGDNIYSLITRVISIMNYQSSQLMVEMCKPDILAKMPFDAYTEVSDYALAKEISDYGQQLMSEALDKYEVSLAPKLMSAE